MELEDAFCDLQFFLGYCRMTTVTFSLEIASEAYASAVFIANDVSEGQAFRAIKILSE